MTLDDILTAARHVDGPGPSTLTRGRDSAIAAVHQDLTSRARIARRRSRRRTTYAAAALTTAVAAAVFVAQHDDRQSPERVALPVPPVIEVQFANASQIMKAAGSAAGREPEELGDAPYWKVVSEYAQTGSGRPDENSSGKRTIWQGIASPGVLSDTFGEGLSINGGKPISLPRATLEAGGRTYTWREVNAGALGPDQLRDLLTAGERDNRTKDGRPPHEWYFFKQAGELLSETPASPAIRQAIWDELATLTGVTTTGKVTDAAGREGWDLTFRLEGYGSQRFIVAPSTGAILQAEYQRRDSTYRVTYLETGPANAAPTPTTEGRMPVETGN